MRQELFEEFASKYTHKIIYRQQKKNEKTQGEEEEKVNNFKNLLKEKGIHANVRWSTFKELVKKDKRYLALSKHQSEDIFKNCIKELKVCLLLLFNNNNNIN